MPLIFRSKEEFEQSVVLQHRDGATIRALVRDFGISRNTVRRILRAHAAQRREPAATPAGLAQPGKLQKYEACIKQLVDQYPKITGQRVFEELRLAGYDGGITILREHLQRVRAPLREPVIRFETAPGQQGQMDWSPYTLRFTRDGKREVLCFSYVLGFSRRQYIAFTEHRDFHTLIRRHVDAFDYFGGVPRECLYDNEKTVVLRWEGGKPVYNPAFTRFITHYLCRPIACRPRHPETKGKVESPFRYVEGNLLNGRTFSDLDDLRQTALWWMAERSDRHVHDTTGKPPLELFLAEERATLQPLPAVPYDTSEVALALCHADGFVIFETNRYSVPTGHLGDILSVKACESDVLVYGPDLALLARHERLPAGRGLKREDPAHHRTKRDRYGLEPVRETFLALGETAGEYLAGLERKQPKNAGFHARFILALKERYLCDDIHRALVHAQRYHAFDGRAIERILQARAPIRTLESVRNERARGDLARILPTIAQRPLSEYDDLLDPREDDHERDPGHPHPDPAAPQDPAPEGDASGARPGTGPSNP
jgi:transposase